MIFASEVASAESAGDALIRSAPIFGPLLLIAIGITIWSIRILVQVQEKRNEATEKYADKMEAANEKDRAHQVEQGKTIDVLAQAVRDLAREIKSNTDVTVRVVEVTNTTIRDAVRRSIKSSSSDDHIPIQRPRSGG